ncbi:MAG: putative cysteine cluster protein YcgN (CxxCxxCC family) [Limisphaerales bacterium]|jgi:uncharacterized cysteine cluster protein YcgN (CxxCxxCC family)
MKFWESKTLAEMTKDEWESLCDGCAQCCMIKLEDEDTEEIHHTAMVCDYLNLDSCRCTDYSARHVNEPDCVVLTIDGAKNFSWLPKSCAYRTLAEGRPLADWHPLLSGRPDSVHTAGVSVFERVVHQGEIHPDEQESMIIQWVET